MTPTRAAPSTSPGRLDAQAPGWAAPGSRAAPRGSRHGASAAARGSRHEARAPIAQSAIDLLDRSRSGLIEASTTSDSSQRFIDAHLAALRAGAALLGARSTPSSRSRLRSVWELLPGVAVETTEWATYFAATARRRAAIERGSAQACTREADDLLRAAHRFVEMVRSALGLPPEAMLPIAAVPAARHGARPIDAARVSRGTAPGAA